MSGKNTPKFEQRDQEQSKEVKKEIERKFLVSELPADLEKYPYEKICQGYIAVTDDGTEVRLRQKGEKFFQTIKSGGTKERTETEIEITQEQYEKLWATTAGKRLEKIRYNIPRQNGTIELDVYQDELSGLMVAEVEFAEGQMADDFEPPEWFGKEVTEEQRYKNKNLAMSGLPDNELVKAPKIESEKLNIPTYELERGIQEAINLIKQKLEGTDGPIIVEVAGGSASGKTSEVARKIQEYYGDTALIFSMDDYYQGKAFMDAEATKGNILNWDQPEALNLQLLEEHLSQLKNGQAIDKPVYDMKVSAVTKTEELKPRRVIILEGLFALNEQVKNEGDVKIFVEIGTHGRILRRLLRDVERTGNKPADILKYFSEVVEPMHEKYIESTKKEADIIINNEYEPKIEAERSGLHEVQLKFKIDIDPETLRKLKAERLGSTTQVDKYYNPADRDLMATGEILRIREEAGSHVLTYKGPKLESDFRERPKFEFEIDKDTEEKFVAIYGKMTKTISKQRTLYKLDGVVFSIDKVSKEQGGSKSELGNFVEIRSDDKNDDKGKLDEVISKLGLNMENGIKESYFEM